MGNGQLMSEFLSKGDALDPGEVLAHEFELPPPLDDFYEGEDRLDLNEQAQAVIGKMLMAAFRSGYIQMAQEVRDIIGRWDTFEGDSGDLIRMMERIDEHIGLRESDDSEEQEDVE